MKESDPLDDGPTNLVVLRSGPGDATVLARPSAPDARGPMEATVLARPEAQTQPQPRPSHVAYELPLYLQPQEPAMAARPSHRPLDAMRAEQLQQAVARHSAESAMLVARQTAEAKRLADKHQGELQRLEARQAREVQKLQPPRRFARASTPPPSAAVRNQRFALRVALILLALGSFVSVLYVLRTEPLAIEHISAPLVRFVRAGQWNWTAIAVGWIGISLLAWLSSRQPTPLALRIAGVAVSIVAFAVLAVPLVALVE